MNILGVGPMEFFLILVIMLVVLGPKNMVETGRKIGVFIRKIIRSPYWSQLMQTQQEIRDLPTKLVREAGIEDELAEIKKLSDDVKQQVDIQKDVQEINQITQEVVQEVDTQIGKRDVAEAGAQIQQAVSTTLGETVAAVQGIGTLGEPAVESAPTQTVVPDQATPSESSPAGEVASPAQPEAPSNDLAALAQATLSAAPPATPSAPASEQKALSSDDIKPASDTISAEKVSSTPPIEISTVAAVSAKEAVSMPPIETSAAASVPAPAQRPRLGPAMQRAREKLLAEAASTNTPTSSVVSTIKSNGNDPAGESPNTPSPKPRKPRKKIVPLPTSEASEPEETKLDP